MTSIWDMWEKLNSVDSYFLIATPAERAQRVLNVFHE